MLAMVATGLGLISTIFWGIWRLAAIASRLQYVISTATKEMEELKSDLRSMRKDVDTIPDIRRDVDALQIAVARNLETAIDKFARLESQVGDLRESRASRGDRT